MNVSTSVTNITTEGSCYPLFSDNSNFFDYPSPWFHYVIVVPIYVFLTWFVSEKIMRRNAAFGLYLSIAGAFIIPFSFAFGILEDGALAIFLLIKCYILTIPVIFLECARLACAGINIETNPQRAREYQKLTKHLPDIVINFVQKIFYIKQEEYQNNNNNNNNTSKQNFIVNKYYATGFYTFLILNILEAIGYEIITSSSDSNPDSNHSWSRFFNIIAGILCMFTIPFSRKKINLGNINKNLSNFNSFWYVDTSNESKYTDYIMYLPNTQNVYYCGIGWIILYSFWNLEFGLRCTSHKSFLSFSIHLILPIYMCLSQRDPMTNGDRFFSLWLQSRAFCLWFFLVFVDILKEGIFKTSGSRIPWLGSGNFLLGLCCFNLVWAIGYTIVWYCYLLPRVDGVPINRVTSVITAGAC